MIANQLLDTGLLQIGLFNEPDKPKTYRLRLDMLPCYPALFQQIVADTAKHLSLQDFDYILADADAAVIAGAIANQAACKLVYSRGRGEPIAIDLIGAYDVGHTSICITNTTDDISLAFERRAVSVGLMTVRYLSIINTELSIHGSDIDVIGVYNLRDIVLDLENENRLPSKQVQAILQETQSK